jgi:hypothetical protein
MENKRSIQYVKYVLNILYRLKTGIEIFCVCSHIYFKYFQNFQQCSFICICLVQISILISDKLNCISKWALRFWNSSTLSIVFATLPIYLFMLQNVLIKLRLYEGEKYSLVFIIAIVFQVLRQYRLFSRKNSTVFLNRVRVISLCVLFFKSINSK